MSSRVSRRSKPLAVQSAEIWLHAPQVVAHRLLRMAMAGGSPDHHDRDEFYRMGAEKVAAFSESWMAMVTETLQMQQKMAMSMTQMWFTPWWMGGSLMNQMAQSTNKFAEDVMRKGLDPIHRRAVANSRRLGRRK